MDSQKPSVPPSDQAQASALPIAPLPKSASLASNLAWRAVANWSSQIVSWAALLVVVRLLSPADFGLVGMSVVLYNYLRLLGTFGIPSTILRHRDLSEEALAQLNTIATAFGVGAFLLACLLVWPLALFFRTPRVAEVALVTCSGLIPMGIRNVPEALMNKNMRLKSLSVFDALRDIMSAGVTILLAWLGFHFWALVLGNLLSDVARCGVILAVQRNRFAWPRLAVIRQPLLFGWHVLVWTFAWSTYSTLDNATAGRVLGQSALGLYGMAWNLANTPLEKIVTLVTTLIPAYLSRVQTDMTALRQYVRSLSEAIALTTFPATIGLALVARQGIPLIMGPKWTGMIVPLEVLSVYAAFRSLVALLPKVLTAVGNARFVMWVEVIGLFLMPLSFWIGSHWGIGGIAFGWVFAYPVIAFALYWKTLKTVEMSAGEYIRALRPALDGSAAMVVAVLWFQWLVRGTRSNWIHLIAEIGIGAVMYVGVVALLHRERIVYFLSIAKRFRGTKKNQGQPAVA